MELLEKVLRTAKNDPHIPMMEEMEEADFDSRNKIKKLMEALDDFQNKCTSLETELSKKNDEIKELKKKNTELLTNIKSLLMSQDSRVKEIGGKYEDMDAQLKIKESKISDLQEKLDNQIKSYGKEISNLKVLLLISAFLFSFCFSRWSSKQRKSRPPPSPSLNGP